jgi:hypothetical protein
MNIAFEVWGFLPVIYRKSRDTWGHARGIFVYLPETYSNVLRRHEVFHVKQWYAVYLPSAATSAAALIHPFLIAVPIALMALASIIYWLPKVRVRREVAAYGESIRAENPQTPEAEEHLISYYAYVMDTAEAYSYEKETLEGIKEMIRRRVKDGHLL